MKKNILLLLLASVIYQLLSAQSVGIGTLTPNANALLHVELGTSTGKGLLVTGTYIYPSTVPDLGAGSRMMFYPGKAAFRAGYVNGLQWNNVNVGEYSTAIGYNTNAVGSTSTAMGNGTNASGVISTAMGLTTTANGNYSTAMGSNTNAGGVVSTAMGFATVAMGNYSTALGSNTNAGGSSSTAMGDYTKAKGYASVVMGLYNDSILLSNETLPNNPISPLFIIGNGTADNARSNAMVVQKNGNVGIGNSLPNADALLHVDLGSSTTKGMLVTGTYSPTSIIPDLGAGIRMMFYPARVAFRAGYVSGAQWNNANVGEYSTAMGLSPTASGHSSTAMGYGTTASGIASTALGNETVASGNYTIAMGYQTTAVGDLSTAMGLTTKAKGTYSTAMGANTTAVGNVSTAMGEFTTAEGNSSTAIGAYTIAKGISSTAMGSNSIAEGAASTAMGLATYAGGNTSTAMGRFTRAKGYASTVIGMYNDSILLSNENGINPITTPLFIIGNGDANNNRRNAMVVQKNGNTGIGVSRPMSTLHVKGTANFFNGVNTRTGTVYNGTSSVSAIELVTSGFDAATADAYMSIQRSGGAGLHIAKPSGYTNSSLVSFGVNGAEVGNITTNGTTTSYNTTSDKRLKENITATHYGLSTIMKLNVKDYNYIFDNKKSLQTGLLAQELYAVYPQAVQAGGSDPSTNPWMVDYSKLTAVLVKAVQELSVDNTSLKQNSSTQTHDILLLKEKLSSQSADLLLLKNELQQIKMLLKKQNP